MPMWIEFAAFALFAAAAAVLILGIVLCLSLILGDWLRARGWDPIFREEVREWEQELGRKLTPVEREALANYGGA